VTPVLTQDGGYLQEVTISKKDRKARPSTYSPAVFTKDGRRVRPFLPTLAGTGRTIGRSGTLGSSYAVKVILLVKFQQCELGEPMSVGLTVCRTFPNTNGETTLVQNYVNFSRIPILLLSLLICEL